MTDDLYERYKEALRVGHVAVLRGSLTAAIDAYRTAAEIAPSRALPHTSLGGVLLRLGRLEEALVEYAAAVARAPRDEGALLGQAEALSAAGERAEAAAALDRVAEIQAESGRLPEAADTLRRAMEQHETPERSRRQSDLLREIRQSAGDQAAEQLLARALRLRDEPAAPSRAAVEPIEVAASPAPEAEAEVPAGVGPEEERPEVAASIPEEPVPPRGWKGWWGADESERPAATAAGDARPADVEPAAVEPEVVAAAAAPSERTEAVVGVMASAGGAPEEEQGPTGDELLAAAEAADSAGDSVELRSSLLATARAYAREGRFEAALDAAHRLLRSAPSDVEAHLVLVELYMARDWNSLASEKLELLERLALLAGDEDTHHRIRSIASRTFPSNERPQAISA